MPEFTDKLQLAVGNRMLYKIVTYFIVPLSKGINIFFLRIFSALLVFLIIQNLAYSATVSEPNNFFIYLAKKGNCQSTDTQLPCEISVQTGVDFLSSIKNCDLLGLWSVSYQPEKSRLNFLL